MPDLPSSTTTDSSNNSSTSATTHALPALRRIVTGHTLDGQSTIQHDTRLETTPSSDRSSSSSSILTPLWYTSSSPADVGSAQANALLPPRMPLASRSAFTAYDLPPRSEGVFHRSITLDYVIVICGRVVLCLEGGERVNLREGDVVVQQATMHAWSNESGEWTRLYGIMVPARAPVVEGRVLADVWPF